jgi:hypothetical protein
MEPDDDCLGEGEPADAMPVACAVESALEINPRDEVACTYLAANTYGKLATAPLRRGVDVAPFCIHGSLR